MSSGRIRKPRAVVKRRASPWYFTAGERFDGAGYGPKKPNTTLYQRLHRAPWLLATSLPHSYGSERRVVQLYRQRMQIGETFRDLKCHGWGFGLRYARCNSAARLEMLHARGVDGRSGCSRPATPPAPAGNTERQREVLSTFFIGRELLKRLDDLPQPVIELSLLTLRHHISSAVPA